MSIKPTNIPKCHLRKSADSAGNISRHCKLGELTENIRTFALPFENQTYTFKMQYEYDSWNRIQTMTYPDGEVVTYDYNLGGMLKSVSGNKNGVPFRYIDSIRYNKFELKDTVWYGNGTRACYAYDSLQRLLHLRSYEGHDSLMQDIAYTYDAAGNIQGIQNTAAALPNGLGGAYRNTYKYDDLYRLSEANCQGTIVEMSYHANGRIHRKTVKRPIIAQLDVREAYMVTSNDYAYNINQPNTLKGVRSYTYHSNSSNQTVEADSWFRWDGCGNMVFHEDEPGNLSRNMVWTEENRLLFVADDSHLSLYLYDAGGERAYKLTGDYHLQNTNGQWFENYTLTTPTLYASPYLVANKQGYTKHYYAESERVASRIGGGGLADLDWNTAHHRVNGAWDNAMGQVRSGHRLLPSPPSNLLTGLFDWQDSVQPETDCYWYHPDHLGSASWVTDADGSAVQHLEYLPWGEDLVDQRLNSFDGVRYTFSAKEKDTETGYSYFGARYYNSDLSIWLSVDPMTDKYPSTSPYAYCRNSPIRLVDPNGMFDDEAKAIKIRNRAVRKYGEERVSDVYNNTVGGGKANYAFSIYGKGKSKRSYSGGTNELGGPVITHDKADKVVSSGKDFRSYRRSQRGSLDISITLTGGVQYGTSIKYKGKKTWLSAYGNAASVDLLGLSYHNDVDGSAFNSYHINQTDIHANSGIALDPLFSYNYYRNVSLEQTVYSEHSFSSFLMETYNSSNNIYDPNSGNNDFVLSYTAAIFLGIRINAKYHPKR